MELVSPDYTTSVSRFCPNFDEEENLELILILQVSTLNLPHPNSSPKRVPLFTIEGFLPLLPDLSVSQLLFHVVALPLKLVLLS